jgi:hypothetical protein
MQLQHVLDHLAPNAGRFEHAMNFSPLRDVNGLHNALVRLHPTWPSWVRPNAVFFAPAGCGGAVAIIGPSCTGSASGVGAVSRPWVKKKQTSYPYG